VTPTYHPRSTWQDPAKPVTGPPAPWPNIDTAVIHYTAADDLIDGDPGEHAENLPAYLRAMQSSYLNTRGYSLGYMYAVDWLGGVWQIRGAEYQSAANRGHNGHTMPILLLVDGADPATREAVASVRWLIAEGAKRAGRMLWQKGHGQLYVETGVGTPTACPGVGLQAQINAGLFAPQLEPDPLPEDDPMIAIYRPVFAGAKPTDAWIAASGGACRPATSYDLTWANDNGVPVVDVVDPLQYANLVKAAGL
jgi:hypothetical protein